MNITNTSVHHWVHIRGSVLAALATVCLTVASLPVRAGDISLDVQPVRITVTYGDLNLANPRGVEVLYQRIVAASHNVCSALDGLSLSEKEQFSMCTAQSIARAVAAVDQPALTALRAIRTGQSDGITKLAKR